MKKAFCEHCLEERSFEYDSEQRRAIIKNEEVEYTAKIAKCEKCGTEVYVPGIDDENVKRGLAAYCKKHGLITQDEIEELLKKYYINDRNLAKVLNLGEITVTRYRKGYLPTKAYSDILLQVLHDERHFYQLLEKNKDKIPESAYRKCIKNKADYFRSERNKTSFEFDYLIAPFAA